MSRPSGVPIVENELAAVTVDVAHIETRGRLNFLPRWRKKVDWLSTATETDTQSLMIFAEPGLISIRAWEPDGPRIQARFAELSTSGDTEAQQALRLIQNRYERLVIPARERASLGHSAVVHLGFGLERALKSVVYVCVYSDRIEVLSPAYRDTKLLEGHELIEDLP
jgi:hypothetical protein